VQHFQLFQRWPRAMVLQPALVLGQNVTGQNVTDTMSCTKYYEDKMLLVKMSRHFVYDIFSTTYFQRHFVQ
jgi:hypothetical protein